MEEDILNFVAITSADPQKAAQYLRLTENNLEQAIELFFESPNLDLGGGESAAAPQHAATNAQDPINIDSDEEMSDFDGDTSSRPNRPAAQPGSIEDDEAMARRLQEEMYGSGGPEEVRAPMARTTETLVGPGSTYVDDIDAMVNEQMAARRRPAGKNRHRSKVGKSKSNNFNCRSRRHLQPTRPRSASNSLGRLW